MIPPKLVRFLEQRANVAAAGTRDHDLVPHAHRVSGWRVGADRRTLTAFIPESFTTHLVDSLEDNHQFALSIEEFPSHETYQFKGTYLGQRPLTNDDVEIVDRIRERWVKSLRPIFADLPVEALRAFIMPASVAVEFQVAEIYLQTPGPGAGARLVPPVEA